MDDSRKPRILLIDSYDSFTCNLQDLVCRVTDATVVTIRNDSLPESEFVEKVLPMFDAVVVGPGPGSPENPEDVGLLNSLWSLQDHQLLPILGVCLGFQSMAYASGGSIARLTKVKHGQPSQISYSEKAAELLANIPNGFMSIRYNSLCVVPAESWDFTVFASTVDSDDPTFTIPMAGKTNSKPFYGVQYHPESICSDYGEQLIENFWNIAKSWSFDNNRILRDDPVYIEQLLLDSSIRPVPLMSPPKFSENESKVVFKSLDFSAGEFPIISFCESLDSEFTMLHSGRDPGRWTIVGILETGKTTVLKHYTDEKRSTKLYSGVWGDEQTDVREITHSQGLWGELADYMEPAIKLYKDELEHIGTYLPFVGGLIGYFSYEEGCQTVPHVTEKVQPTGSPDTYLVDIKKTIIIDNHLNCAHLISLEGGNDWIEKTCRKFEQVANCEPSNIPPLPLPISIDFPDKNEYIQKIMQAQEYLQSGNSYELCLCGQTKIHLGETVKPWDLYKVLLGRNPAPHSCFMNFGEAALVGASPERFMSWRRDGVCEFRPIKGTVKKGPEISRQEAIDILNSPKERGENLMIVDLIRHDLNMVLRDVVVDKLMTVEEYETVYQLVSVISGKLHGSYTGIDLLAHSLPPGSMTGAPKIRSVQLLRGLEDHQPRGIYSGVAGYWSVTDEGDWSVVIRSAMTYNKDEPKGSVWRIGAGGAITVLSDPEAEWDEMNVKLESALKAFG